MNDRLPRYKAARLRKQFQIVKRPYKCRKIIRFRFITQQPESTRQNARKIKLSQGYLNFIEIIFETYGEIIFATSVPLDLQ